MANKSDQEAAEAYRARLKKQASYSAKNRDKNRASRRPGRDDMASAALRLLLKVTVEKPEDAPVWAAAISRDFARLKKPFDPVETTAVFNAMVERHREVMAQAERQRTAELASEE